MAITIELDAQDVIQTLSMFPEALREQVAAMAVNKTLAKAKTEMKRQILAVYNLTSTEVGTHLLTSPVSRKLNKYTATLTPSTLSGKNRAMNVIHFMQGFSSGDLVFKFKKMGGDKVIGPSGSASKPFIGNAGRTVFRRTGKGRLPIEAVQVIDIPQMFNSKVINQAVLDKASADLLYEAETALNYLLSKMGASRG